MKPMRAASVGQAICLLLVCLTGWCAADAPATLPAAMSVDRLRCNGLVQPTVTAASKPVFSWIMRSSEENQKQTAYQLVVEGMWDTGRVESDHSINVEYAGKQFEPSTCYTWRVRIWDAHRQPSDWSEPARFFTGPDAWSAKWIELPDPAGFPGAHWIWFPEGHPEQSAPVGTRYFRKTVSLPKNGTVKSASFAVIADDTFELRVNGNDVSQSRVSAHLVRFDAAANFHGGDNQIEVAVINAGKAPSPAGLLVALQVEMDDGTIVDAPSGRDWESSMDKQTWVPSLVLGDYGMAPGRRHMSAGWGSSTCQSMASRSPMM
jgi:alpha-L-rhamnosidase